MNQKGFTLLETMIAIVVITVGAVSVMSLIHRATLGAQLASSRLVAAYLAQEGLEIVRNIRDSNWLEQRENPEIAWDQNLPSGNWEADFDDFTLTPFQNRNLKVNGGFYNYSAGGDTKFKRKIAIAKPDSNTLEVSVEISWSERGSSFTTSFYENLYNWK